MNSIEGKRLAELSAAVRESTVKRLKLVPPGSENWRVDDDAMSFADMAKHIVEADRWMFRLLERENLKRMSGEAHAVEITDRSEYVELINDLEETGRTRNELLRNMTEEQLNEEVYDERFGGEVGTWWVIVRGNLDHEVHHRGQISVYLKMVKSNG